MPPILHTENGFTYKKPLTGVFYMSIIISVSHIENFRVVTLKHSYSKVIGNLCHYHHQPYKTHPKKNPNTALTQYIRKGGSDRNIQHMASFNRFIGFWAGFLPPFNDVERGI